MTSIADSSIQIQTSSELAPCAPSWFGEVVLMAAHLKKQGVLTKLCEQVRFARKRFGQYEVIDFLVVLIGYAISGEHTLEEFYKNLQPFAVPFMALFDRDRLPSRSALSRFLAALTQEPVEALRTLFLDDLLSRSLTPDNQTGCLTDRTSHSWIVFDIDGTREVVLQKRKLICEDRGKKNKRSSFLGEQSQNLFKWRHFQTDIILLCVRWYMRSALSSRESSRDDARTRLARGSYHDLSVGSGLCS